MSILLSKFLLVQMGWATIIKYLKMSRYKEPRQQLVDQLLYGEDSHNLSQEQNYNEVDQVEEEFIYNMSNDHQWNSNDNIEQQLLRINGPSVQFSQNYSQNYSQSSMLGSHRHDDSRDYRQEPADNKYLRILEEKKKEEIQFNEALDKQLTATKQKLERSEFEYQKLRSINAGLQKKIQIKDQTIENLELQIDKRQQEVQKQRQNLCAQIATGQVKDKLFNQYKQECNRIMGELSSKEKQIAGFRKQIQQMAVQIQKLNKALAVYGESDRRLFDFRGGYKHQSVEAPLSPKHSHNDKELQKLKRQKISLQIQISALKDKFQERENHFKKVEDEYKKKTVLKQKRISDLEKKISELKNDQMTNKTQNDVTQEKLNNMSNTLSIKTKQISTLLEKHQQSDKRIKALLEDGKKKDQKVKEITLQCLEKNKILTEKAKEVEQLKIKIEFDHQMIQDKDKELQKLLQERKTLKSQLDNMQKHDRTERADKTEKDKVKKDLQKIKKDIQIVKKENEMLKKEVEASKKLCQALEKEKQDATVGLKQYKRKFEQASKKLRSATANLEDQLHVREDQLQYLQDEYERVMNELSQYKKKQQTVPQLRNKIILLQSRLKTEQFRQTNESMESTGLQDRLQALEQRLEERDKENRSLKSQLKKNHCSDEEYQELAYENADLQEQIAKRDARIQQLTRELQFKDNTLEFTHKILVKSEKAKIELQQQNQLLEQKLNNESFEGTKQELAQFYDEKILSLETDLERLRRICQEKQEEHRFNMKQQKERIRQLNEMVLNKQKKITPETMSQQDTVHFLTKIIKKVYRSAEMIKMLSRSQDFREGLDRINRELRR